MRILEAFGEPVSYGGQESFVMNVLDNMDRSDLEIDLLSPYYCDNESIRERVREYGGEVYTLGCDFRPGGLRINVNGPVRKFLREHHYDVIHIHSGSNSMLSAFARAAAEAGIPRVIVHSHCTGIRGWKHAAARLASARTLLRCPTDYLACSREAGEWRFPRRICRNDLKVINNGIDVEQFRYDKDVRERMRSQLGTGDDTKLVICVGRLAYQKNQSFLLDVMDIVRKRSDEEGSQQISLLLVGDGEDREMLMGKTHALGLDDNVIFAGAVDNVQDYMQAADAAVMPSRYEGLAIAVIEAQAAGLEIIVSDAIPESAAVTDNVTFLPIDDETGWAREIMKDHGRHPEQADTVAARGYSIKDTAESVRRLYRTPDTSTTTI